MTKDNAASLCPMLHIKRNLDHAKAGSRESAATVSQCSAKTRSEDFRSSLVAVPGGFVTFMESKKVKSISR